jgi:ABC-type polar amino acid transport system ATPase subunit
VCLIAGMLSDYSNVIKVLQTCYRMVSNSQRSIDSGGLNAGNTTLIRCLYLLGLFAQHGQIDANTKIFNEAFGVTKNVSVTAMIAKSLASFTRPVVPESLRKIAITSYGTIPALL